MACAIRGISVNQAGAQMGISSASLFRLRQGKTLEADCLAALVAWLYPSRIPHWIRSSHE